jgi:uncharacterized protein (TIGR02284 family)
MSEAVDPGAPSRRSEEIEAEIAQIRSRMDRTIGAIEERLQPSHWSPDTLLRSVVDGTPHPLTDAIRRNPLAAALIGIGAVWLTVGLLRGSGAPKRARRAAGPDRPARPLVQEVMELVGVTRRGTRAMRHAGVALESLQAEGELADLVRHMAEERGRTAGLLQDELQRVFGLAAIHGEPVSPAAARFWEKVERAVDTRDKIAILRALEQAENDTVRRFRAVLHRPMPEHVRVVIGNRFQEVLQAGHRLDALRQAVT